VNNDRMPEFDEGKAEFVHVLGSEGMGGGRLPTAIERKLLILDSTGRERLRPGRGLCGRRKK